MRFEYVYGIKAWDKYPSITVGLEVITPETAIAMLETNENNRPMKREALIEAIENGEWVITNDMIVFSDEGELLNGQNRLIACVKTGKPIVVFVARGFSKEWQVAMDGGIKRTVADFLAMMGYPSSKNLATIGRAVCRASDYGIEAAFSKPNNAMSTTKYEVDFIVENYDRLKSIYNESLLAARKYKGLSMGTTAALFDEFKSIDIESYEMFVGMLLGKYAPDHNMMMLTGRLNDNAQRTQGRMPQKNLAALIVKTWNAFINGEEIKALRFRVGGASPESFPAISRGWE